MILQTVQLITSDYVKEFSTVSENMEEKYINPCIYTAQVQNLQELIGTKLSVRLCEMVDDETITDPENAVYNDLLTQYVQPFLLACCQSELLISNMAKLRNSGNMQYLDTNQQNVNSTDVKYLVEHYRNQATFLGNRVTDFCKCHKNQLKEYCTCETCCSGLKPDGESAIKIGFVL